MADFGPQIAGDVAAACRTNAGEIAGGLSRTFDATISVEAGEPCALDVAAWPAGFDGPGLAVLLMVDNAAAAVAVLPEASGLLPGWYRQPDATGKSKLTTLAQELGMLVLPDAFMPADFKAAHVPNLAEALLRAGAATGAGLVPLSLTAGGASGSLSVIWPIGQASALYSAPAATPPAEAAPPAAKVASAAPRPEPKPAPRPAPAPQPASVAPPSPAPRQPAGRLTVADLDDLPLYARSLLRVEVPVIVTLASKKQSIARIVELGPGSIIQFEKSCDQLLSLEVGNELVAEGEAVKVGDKFGIRVTSLLLPDERFKPVRPLQRT